MASPYDYIIHVALIASFQHPLGEGEGESGEEEKMGGVGVGEEQGTKGTKGALCSGANVNWIMLKYVLKIVLLVVCGL